jgi:hypothetical protein
MLRRFALGLLTAIVLLPASCTREEPDRLPGGSPLSTAINRAADFLGSTPLEHDELWFVHQASRRLGRGFPRWAAGLRENAAPAGAEQVLAELRDLDMHRFPLLIGQQTILALPRPARSTDKKTANQLISEMFFAVHDCRAEKADTVERVRGLLGLELHGYLLAHQAWMLAVAASRGCVSVEEAAPYRKGMGEQLQSELVASQGLDDLDLERMAVLCLLDLCHWVPKDSFDRAIAHQLPSGSWGKIPPAGGEPKMLRETHTVALGFFALASLNEMADPPSKRSGLGCERRASAR